MDLLPWIVQVYSWHQELWEQVLVTLVFEPVQAWLPSLVTRLVWE